jgi:hypothetical protein
LHKRLKIFGFWHEFFLQHGNIKVMLLCISSSMVIYACDFMLSTSSTSTNHRNPENLTSKLSKSNTMGQSPILQEVSIPDFDHDFLQS